MLDLDNTARLWKIFNLSSDDVRAIYQAQRGECAICETPITICSPGTGVDHDHKNGLIRGLLCHLCNRALGLFADNPERLKAALEYLSAPPASSALGEPRYGRRGRTTNKLGRHKRKNLRPRGASWAGYAPTVVYACGCKDYDPRPLKACPIHKQPEQRAAAALLRTGLFPSGDALTSRNSN